MIKQAVILAGGQGTRLRPLTFTTPKPLIPIYGKPFVQYLIERLKENGIEEIVFLTGYLGEQIKTFFGDGKKLGIKIQYSQAPVEYETGARIRNAKKMLANTFLLLYCDNYWPLDLGKLTEFYKKVGTQGLVTIYKNNDGYTKNNIHVNEKGIVEAYDKTRQAEEFNGVDIGFFILKKSILADLPEKNFSFEKIIIPRLVKRKQLAGFLTHHKYYGLSNIERIPVIEKFFRPKKIIFLDRDGVINKKPAKGDYVKTKDEFELLPHAIAGMQMLQKNDFEIFIITNQAGIARGVIQESDLVKIHKKLLQNCNKNGVRINTIYYCPHGWNDNCFCRKPQPGMLFKAAAEHHFDLTKALFIGDDERDEQAGVAAGCKTMVMPPNSNLLETVKYLLREN